MPRYLVTSALPYINGVKHLGNLVGSMLPADVYSRFIRQRGDEVLFICATDEHGTPAELAALEANLPVSEYCRQQYEVMSGLVARWGLSFDHFGRSSSPQNAELTQQFAIALEAKGLIEERSTVQAYSVDDQRFLPDRYVIGTCPHCDFDRARGDQCENCTRVLDPADLINPRSATSGSSRVEFRESNHLFLRQSVLADEIRSWIESKTDWPVLSRSIALKWLDEGLEDRGITRDLEWGVPVPAHWKGFENKVFYVWFDAPIEYIGATKEWADVDPSDRDWQSWWDASGDVIYTQFMAKDNVPFHTISFPATILGSGQPWKLVDNLKSFSWLNYYGGKFSTSQGRGVFMHDALEVLPADTWRYFLLANAPENGDADFTWELVANAINKDLSGAFGNFVNRTLKFASANFDGAIPHAPTPGVAEESLVEALVSEVALLHTHYEEMQFRKTAQQLRRIWSLGNEYIDQVAPWRLIKTDREQAALAVKTSIGLIRLYALLGAPIMPNVSATLLRSIGEPEDFYWPEDVRAAVFDLKSGSPFSVPSVLFPKLTSEEVAEHESRFGAKT